MLPLSGSVFDLPHLTLLTLTLTSVADRLTDYGPRRKRFVRNQRSGPSLSLRVTAPSAPGPTLDSTTGRTLAWQNARTPRHCAQEAE